MNRPLLQRRLLLGIKFALAVALLAWLASSDRLQLSRLASVPISGKLLLLFVLIAGAMAIPALRWWWLLRIQDIHEPLLKIVGITWSGYLAALILPGAASGDLAKTYLILRQRDQGRARAFSTILADRFLGMHSLFCLGAFPVLWLAVQGQASGRPFQIISAAILIPFGLMSVGLAVLLWFRTRQVLFLVLPEAWRVAWNQSFASYYAKLPQLVGCFGLSLFSSFMSIVSLTVSADLLGQFIQWNAAFLAAPLIIVANCLPITPGGIGLGEVVSSELFEKLGTNGGAEMMILNRVGGTLLSLPALSFFFMNKSDPSSLAQASLHSHDEALLE